MKNAFSDIKEKMV